MAISSTNSLTKYSKQEAGMSSGIVVCYLMEESKRITSPTFKVWVPSIMNGFEGSATESSVTASTSNILNTRNKFTSASSIQTQGYIIGRNVTAYGHRLDGWCPKFTIEQLTAEDGTFATMTSATLTGAAQGGMVSSMGIESETTKVSLSCSEGSHPAHSHEIQISGGGGGGAPGQVSMVNIEQTQLEQKTIVFNKLVATTSEGFDFQELNHKYIKKGHKMYGSFVDGIQNEFIIIGIDQATPYLEQTEDAGIADNADSSFDGGATNVAN